MSENERKLWYRVFGSGDEEPAPAAILERLNSLAVVAGQFRGDDTGWFSADFTVAGMPTLQMERFLACEEGIRAELNSWAAHLETQGDAPEITRMMERIIQTRQLFTLARTTASDEEPFLDELSVTLCCFLAETTDGVYQIDGSGFFAADGKLLVRDEPT